jgi:hypothetical protein
MVRRAILGLSLLACVAQAQSTEDKIHLRATVKAIVMLSHFSGEVITVDLDPRFALTLRIESANPSVYSFREGALVTLAIHSPALLFGGKPKEGETYNFSLSRTTENRKIRFFGLQLE